MREKIELILKEAINRAFEKGLIKDTSAPIVIEIPNRVEHGHFATNIAMNLAPKERKPPKQIALLILDNIEDKESILEKVEIAGPGFINFWIKTDAWYRVLIDILRQGKEYGEQDIGKGKKILVEFVSANPTGPLHIGHARGAALGDTLCRIMSFCGYDVTKEFYINDAGQQIELLGESIFSRFKQISDPEYPFPEDGYHVPYVMDLAKRISEKINLDNMQKEKAIELCAEEGKKIMLEEIKKDLSDFGVEFDVWFSEKSLFDSGLLNKTLKNMEEKGFLYEKIGI